MAEDTRKQTVKITAIRDLLHPLAKDVAEQVITRTEAAPPTEAAKFCVFGPDYQLYGPVPVETLQEWAQRKSISHDSWVYDYQNDYWCRARGLTQIRRMLPPKPEDIREGSCAGLQPTQVRRCRIFADMTDHEIEDLFPYMTRAEIPANKPVMSHGAEQHHLSMVLAGEATMFISINGVMQGLGSLVPGDSFCEQCLVEKSPGPYDVQARTELTLIRIKHSEFQRLKQQHHDLAIKLLGAALTQVYYRACLTLKSLPARRAKANTPTVTLR